jgi:hypothetical protein
MNQKREEKRNRKETKNYLNLLLNQRKTQRKRICQICMYTHSMSKIIINMYVG